MSDQTPKNESWRASEDKIKTTDHPAVALHHAVNLASRADNDRRRYITTHVTGDAMSVLDRCGWKLVRKEEPDE